MFNSSDFLALSFNVSKDGKSYFKLFEIGKSSIDKMRNSGHSSSQIIGSFFSSGKELILGGNIIDFCLQLWNGKDWLDISYSTGLNFYDFKDQAMEDQKLISVYKDQLSKLNSHELEVFRYLEIGESELRIADKLNKSLSTIKTYRRHIYSKMGFHSKIDLLLWIQKYKRHL